MEQLLVLGPDQPHQALGAVAEPGALEVVRVKKVHGPPSIPEAPLLAGADRDRQREAEREVGLVARPRPGLDVRHRATGGNPGGIDGITGASVGAGRTLEITLDLADALFDAGYRLHIDAAVEDMRDSPNEVAVPLTTSGTGTRVPGRRYVSSFTYSR